MQAVLDPKCVRQRLRRRGGKPARPVVCPQRWNEAALTETWVERKLRRAMETTTTVSLVVSMAHTDPDTREIHGHDYEVHAEFPRGERFEVLKARLRKLTDMLDHTQLPAALWSAENIGEFVFERLDGVLTVQVNRPWLGHYVTVKR